MINYTNGELNGSFSFTADNRPNDIDCPRKKKILPDFRLLSEEAVEENDDDAEDSDKELYVYLL